MENGINIYDSEEIKQVLSNIIAFEAFNFAYQYFKYRHAYILALIFA